MAIEKIHDVFPGVKVEWQRTARVPQPQMVVEETTSHKTIAAFPQEHMSDDLYGPGVEELQAALKQFKAGL